jgi:hypothetical protein
MADVKPKWTYVKSKVAGLDLKGLVDLVHDLYTAHKDNRTFLHARLLPAEREVLEPYRKTIKRWMYPNYLRRQSPSVANARQAIWDYKRAAGESPGMAELMVYFCGSSGYLVVPGARSRPPQWK